MQWLSNPNVVGIFLAPPCGSASRARAIPMKRKRPGRTKISKANRLYHLTAQLVTWAQQEGCLICIENPHLLQFSFFQACQYGGTRPKRTMLAFNTDEFSTINKMCNGGHSHEKWGLQSNEKVFATSLEAAYPMQLARTIAAAFVLVLQRRGIRMPPDTCLK